MLPKYAKRSYILDKIHRGSVMILMGITVIAGIGVVYKGFYYYRYIRPALREIQMSNDEKLLKEGKYKPAVN